MKIPALYRFVPKDRPVTFNDIIRDLELDEAHRIGYKSSNLPISMKSSLVLTPAGHLLLKEETSDSPSNWEKEACGQNVARAFSTSQAAGLFALAASKPGSPPPPSFAFWRNFACAYLTRLCRTPESAGDSPDPVNPPGEEELAAIALGAPLLQGGEYLNAPVLAGLWEELDMWTREAVASSGLGLTAWLGKHAAIWHQVGRVCFHLAENKRDPEYPFAFMGTYAPRLSGDGRVQYQPLGKALQEYAGEQNKAALVRLLTPVRLATEKSEIVKELVDSGDIFSPLAWTPGEAFRFLQDVPMLEESGILVRIPDWWRKRPRPRVAVTIGEKKKTRFGTDAIMDFKLNLALGDDTLSEQEFRRIMEAENGLVYLKGQWVEVNREKLTEALEHWKLLETEAAGGGISFIEGMRLLAGAPADLDGDNEEETQQWSFVQAGSWLSDILNGLRDPAGRAPELKKPSFRGTLRPYQEIGYNWLWFLASLGLGACLADDMGLGKTIQVLSLLVSLKKTRPPNRRPSLLVLPASLLANWKSELKRFAPGLSARFVHPSESSKKDLAALSEDPAQALSSVDLVLTTYGMLLRQDWLLDIQWRLVVLDESQAIKNPATRQTRIVKKLKAGARIALTGTPVENRLSDLWSLFDFLCPGLLGSFNRFKQFVKTLEDRTLDRYAPLRNLVSPYILRRLKTDKTIISDLPDKTEIRAFCGLTKKQAALYTGAVDELADALENVDGIKRRGMVLAYLLRFKQICNHPSQLTGDGVYAPESSGKFDRLKEICDEIASRQEKALVFTQFREMTKPLAAFLTPIFGREGLVLHGGTTVKKRKPLVDAFQTEDGPPFFVLSLKAGGTGLNLTAASHVIHFDRWWNPAVENQATDRAFRIGQHKNVLVHKFVCRGTIEEKIDELIKEKQQLSGDLLRAGAESMLTELDDKELLQTVTLDIERAGI